MDFIPTTIRGLFDNSIQFRIPIYQRAYSWKKENWVVFMQDLLEQIDHDNVYSYGSLLLETIKKDLEYDIIDGQQRLTTLIIFMRAMHNVLVSKGVSDEELGEIEDFFKRKGKKRLRPIQGDASCFDSVIVENECYHVSSESQKCIVEAKEFFIKTLDKLEKDTIIKIRDIVLDSKVNRLELQGKKESALIFELQNNRGKDLTNMEKLKSFFMYQMYVNSPADETDSNIEEISGYFKDIYSNVYDIKGLDEDNILIYHCNAYLNCSFGYRNLEDIKTEMNRADDRINWIKAFARELSTTFAHIKTLQSNSSVWYKKMFRIKKEHTLPAFAYPFVIKGYKYFEKDPNKLNKLFHFLEILIFRSHLMSSRADISSRLSGPLKSFNGDIDALIKTVHAKLNSERYWSDADLRNTLSGWMFGHNGLRYVLWEYEESIQRKGYKIGTIAIENEQIEHISPQTPTNGTPLETGYDVDENNQYSEEFSENYLNCLGNLMLISGSHNASIGNKPFTEKLESYKQNPLLNQQAEIKDFLSPGSITWKQENIIKRLHAILAFALARWDFSGIE